MLSLGLKIPERRNYNWTDYNEKDLNSFRRSDAHYIVFIKPDFTNKTGRERPVFENNQYIVFRLVWQHVHMAN